MNKKIEGRRATSNTQGLSVGGNQNNTSNSNNNNSNNNNNTSAFVVNQS